MGKYPELGANDVDRATAMLRGLVSLVPGIGSMLAEAITEIVPDQRLDRIERFLLLLANELERLAALVSATALADVRTPENIDLIERGAAHATKALTDERIKYIAQCVANGINADERGKIHHRRLLSIIGELDDDEITLLAVYATGDRNRIRSLQPPPAHIVGTEDAITTSAMHDAAKLHLERLGLLHFQTSIRQVSFPHEHSSRPLELHFPETDWTGQRRGWLHVTALGEMVLKAIGVDVERTSSLTARPAPNPA